MRRFSQRYGFKPVKDQLQGNSMDKDLRNSLWNALHIIYWGGVGHDRLEDNTEMHGLFTLLCVHYFKEPIDTIPYWWSDAYKQLKTYFFKCQWDEVYDFIEFVAKSYPDDSLNEQFMDICNKVLKREVSAYRFVGSQIVRITAEEEIAEIEEALKVTDTLRPAAIHLKTAMGLLSDRKAPDYRNSIKESISAVETICRLISGRDDATLGEALKVVKGKIDLHPALEKAFDSLYGYTSDEGGIRHALMGVPGLDFEDAKFMLVSCAAFINYLKLKSSKAGINF